MQRSDESGGSVSYYATKYDAMHLLADTTLYAVLESE